MTARAHAQTSISDTPVVARASILQRACACGGTAGVSGKCAGCEQQERLGVQPKLTVNAPGDRYEQETQTGQYQRVGHRDLTQCKCRRREQHHGEREPEIG